MVSLINLEVLLPQLSDVTSWLSFLSFPSGTTVKCVVDVMSCIFMILTSDTLVSIFSFGLIFSPSASVLKLTYDFVMFQF